MSLEARVGLFVLGALALLIGFVLVLGDFHMSHGLVVHADFAYAGSLQSGAPVRVGGMSVGRVGTMSLIQAGADPMPAAAVDELGRTRRPVVRAELLLDERVVPAVTESARFSVATQGIMGESYVEMAPGRAQDRLLVDGASVRGVDAPQVHTMVLQAEALLGELRAVLGALDGSATAAAGQSLAGLLDTLSSLLVAHRTELESAIVDGVATVGDARATVAALKQSVGSGQALTELVLSSEDVVSTLRQRLPALLSRTDGALLAVQQVADKANEAVDAVALKQALTDARIAATDLKHLLHMGRQLVAAVERGDGTVGGLVNDAQMYDDLKELMRDLKRHPWKVFWRD